MKLQICFLLFLLTGVSTRTYGQFPEASNLGYLMKGSIDLHIHSAPDMFGRSVNDLQAAQLAKSHGMKAIVVKNHVSSTAGRAALVNEMVEGIDVYGGIVLNRAVGGINPEAVRSMARLSPRYGKMVWFPTFDAQSHKRVFGVEGEGLTILDNGKLIEEAEEVLQIILEHDLILATGHLSPEEVDLLVYRAHEIGIRNILITHPHAEVPGLSLDQMLQLSRMGAKIELAYLSYLKNPESHLSHLQSGKHVSVEQMVNTIRTVGADHVILTSDLGQSGNPIPTDGLMQFINLLIANGVTPDEITKMVKDNPGSFFE